MSNGAMKSEGKRIHRKMDLSLTLEGLEDWLYREGRSLFLDNGYGHYDDRTMKEALEECPVSTLEQHKGRLHADWDVKFIEKWWDAVNDDLSELVRYEMVFMGDDGLYYTYESFVDPNIPETGNLYEEWDNLPHEVREDMDGGLYELRFG